MWGLPHWRFVLQRDDEVLLYQQQGLGLGTYSGVTRRYPRQQPLIGLFTEEAGRR